MSTETAVVTSVGEPGLLSPVMYSPKDAPAVPETCTLCGHLPGTPVKLSDEEDRKEVFRAVLGRRPFRKMYMMFNGEFQVILRTLMTPEQALQLTLEAKFNSLDDLKETEIDQLRLLFSVEQLGEKPLPKPAASMTVEEVRALISSSFADIDYLLLCKVAEIRSAFLNLYEQIIEEGFDANFYKGAGRI